jgi:hypothetical protein
MTTPTRAEITQAVITAIDRAIGNNFLSYVQIGEAADAAIDAFIAAMPPQSPEPPRCPKCGYTAHDAAIHMDHHLCSGKIPGAPESQPKEVPEDHDVPYRPSCGSEGADFMARFCDLCSRDAAYRDGAGDSCPIAAASLTYLIDQPGYPAEWIRDEAGPRCTAFEAEATASAEGRAG